MKIAALFVLLCSISFARLGETSAQLTTRFGQPKTTSTENIVAQGKIISIGSRLGFQQDDWAIYCTVTEGRCSRITYTKPGEWSEQQIETVLSSNSQGAKWTEISKPNFTKILREWRRADGGTARWGTSSFTLTQPAYENAKKKAEAKAKGDASKTPNI